MVSKSPLSGGHALKDSVFPYIWPQNLNIFLHCLLWLVVRWRLCVRWWRRAGQEPCGPTLVVEALLQPPAVGWSSPVEFNSPSCACADVLTYSACIILGAPDKDYLNIYYPWASVPPSGGRLQPHEQQWTFSLTIYLPSHRWALVLGMMLGIGLGPYSFSTISRY